MSTHDERLAAVRAAAEIIPSTRTKRAINRLSLGIPEQPKGGAAADTLAWHAEAIRALGKRVIGDAIEMGRHLTAAKKLCGPGNWSSWLSKEFDWTDDTALNLMRCYQLSESRKFRDLHLPLSGLYLLARPSTPERVRQEIFDRAERGERVSVDDVRDVIRSSSPPTSQQPKPRHDKPKAEPPTPDEINM